MSIVKVRMRVFISAAVKNVKNTFTYAIQNQQCAALANQLSTYGPTKSVENWKKVSQRNEGMLANIMFLQYSSQCQFHDCHSYGRI